MTYSQGTNLTLPLFPGLQALLLESDAGSSQEIQKISLVYPREWAVPLNPLAKEMESRALLWLKNRGVIYDRATEEKFLKLSVGEYANWPFPLADAERAEIITKFLALWIFYDDLIEEQDDGQLHLIDQAILGQDPRSPHGSPHLKCWWELGRAYARLMSVNWCRRHAKRFHEWVLSVREESRVAQVFRHSGKYPSSISHLERRRLNIGMIPNIDFLELQMDWELSPEYLGDPALLELENISAEVVAIINDFFGYSKDMKLKWCNLVSCLMDDFKINPQESFQWVANLHNSRVLRFDQVAGELLDRWEGRPQLAQWVQGLRYIMYGFAKWHSRAPRYCHQHQLGSVYLKLNVVSPSHPQG